MERKDFTEEFLGGLRVLGTVVTNLTLQIRHRLTPMVAATRGRGNPFSTKEFKDILYTIHGEKIKLISNYTNSQTRVTLKCSKGHTWDALPRSVTSQRKNGKFSGCRKCSYLTPKKKVYSQALFKRKLETTKVRAKPLEKYKGAKTKIKWGCVDCKHRWSATPSNVFSKRSCPKCARKDNNALDVLEVTKRIKHLKIKIDLNNYTSASKRYSCECLSCGHKWEPILSTLIRQKYGCPICANNNTGYRRYKHKIHGRIFETQGYEHLALKHIIEEKGVSASDIKTGINVKRFSYREKNKTRTYLPDIQVGNRIIEVKSEYTMLGREAWFKNLVRKRQAVVGAGLKFSLYVYDKKERKIKLPRNWYTMKYAKIKSFL